MRDIVNPDFKLDEPTLSDMNKSVHFMVATKMNIGLKDYLILKDYYFAIN